jgi:hypothetical protein
MIYELRAYTMIPGKQGEYLKFNAEIGRPTRGQKYGTLEGSWTTEFGTLNQFVITTHGSRGVGAHVQGSADGPLWHSRWGSPNHALLRWRAYLAG